MRTIITIATVLFAAAVLAPPAAVAASAASSGYSWTLSAQKRAPSPTCERDKQACMRGSAQTGTYGARYVPPKAVKMCMDAYRACISRH